jgi:fumarate hydratase subunit beta
LERIILTTPLSDHDVEKLRSGQRVLLNGIIYTARDAAHKRLIELIEQGKELPFNLKGQAIYYVGPTPARPGAVIGAAGPTTSYRMDPYTPKLYELGLKASIGKGARSESVIKALKQYKGIYFAAVGGAAALISKCIKACRVIAYPELGAEAIHELLVENFPVIVVNDIHGGNFYEEGITMYASK